MTFFFYRMKNILVEMKAFIKITKKIEREKEKKSIFQGLSSSCCLRKFWHSADEIFVIWTYSDK